MPKVHIVITRVGNALTLDGVSTYIWELATALSETGLRVTVCSGFGNANLNVRAYIERYFGVSFKGDYISLKSGCFRGQSDLLFTWSVKGSGLIKELDPDIIHINGALPLLCMKPKVATYHGIMNFDSDLSASKLVLNAFYDRIFYRFCECIMTVSGNAKKEFLRYIGIHRPAPLVVPPMINTLGYRTPELSSRENAILHRGTHSRKNLRGTLLAFSYLKEKIPDVKLYVIGSMQDVKTSSKALGLRLRDIKVISGISKQEMEKLYSHVRITFMPSYYEAFGYVALESLASGTPVIASSAVANELVRPEYNGFYAPPNDPKIMAAYAYGLLTDEELWAFMSENAVKVAEEFSRERILPKVLSVYKAALNSPLRLLSD